MRAFVVAMWILTIQLFASQATVSAPVGYHQNGTVTQDELLNLLERPFPDSQLPPGFATAEVGQGRRESNGYSVDVSVWYPRSTVQSIKYWIYDSPSSAEREYMTYINIMNKDQGMTAYRMDGLAYPTTLLTSGTVYEYTGANAVCASLMGQVFITGVSVGENTTDSAVTSSCLLADAGISHLQSLGYAPESSLGTQADIRTPTTSAGSDAQEMPGATFSPDHLSLSLGDRVTVTVHIPATQFYGFYSLVITLPEKIDLASPPACLARTGDDCVGFAPDVSSANRSRIVDLSGAYNAPASGVELVLDLEVLAAPPRTGSVAVTAELIWLTSSGRSYKPIESQIEVEFK